MLHAPSQTAKLAGVAALVGLMMTVAIVAATRQPAPASAPLAVGPGGERHDPLARELDRCAALTMPDAGCDAAWAANRRRFFHQSEAESGAAPSTNETVAP